MALAHLRCSPLFAGGEAQQRTTPRRRGASKKLSELPLKTLESAVPSPQRLREFQKVQEKEFGSKNSLQINSNTASKTTHLHFSACRVPLAMLHYNRDTCLRLAPFCSLSLLIRFPHNQNTSRPRKKWSQTFQKPIKQTTTNQSLFPNQQFRAS